MTPLLWLAVGVGVALVGRVTGFDPHRGLRGSLVIGALGALIGGVGFHVFAEIGHLAPTFPNIAAALMTSAYFLVGYYAVHVPDLVPVRRSERRRPR